jgi:prevent-host-death family protein
MNINRDIQPMSTFKRKTNKMLEQIEETKQPLILTVHGKAKAVLMDAETYQNVLDENARLRDRLETIAGIHRGLEDMKHGREQPLEKFDKEFRKKYNIPQEDIETE